MEQDHENVVTPDIMATQTQILEEVTSSIGKQENEVEKDRENHGENAEKQLVLYHPAIAVVDVAAAIAKVKCPPARRSSLENYTSKAAEVGAFAVQCARCFKWRYIPTAEKYYVTPSGKQLRSKVQIQKYLEQHPEYVAQGVKDTQFLFQIPRPLQQNYVKKRPAPSLDGMDVL
ncbi:hypothetical protein K7X08_011698 [Anisodus acutangulus]|uniref:MBD domain-containing protein n=1 Tax=Anisodus acutangulus TaxID=402998 RepID=A0A9Q1ML72_9SOLA|nr:hypothetical protein K7X08_011695 [Anisodus acutangulus]KAJ8562405.1 hypothetical protein K7X08_011696 [Anisodus acutangulus]KAJ8562407.1 hypothetical protein K7X08_011698 [Anisodus acutangulus]